MPQVEVSKHLTQRAVSFAHAGKPLTPQIRLVPSATVLLSLPPHICEISPFSHAGPLWGILSIINLLMAFIRFYLSFLKFPVHATGPVHEESDSLLPTDHQG